MQRSGNDVKEAMRRQRTKSVELTGMEGTTITVGQQQAVPVAVELTPSQLQTPGAPFQQSPLQHFIMTSSGQVQSIQSIQGLNVAVPHQATGTARQQLLAGMMVMPPLSPSRGGFSGQQATIVAPSTQPSTAGSTTTLLVSQDGRELQIAPAQVSQQATLAATTFTPVTTVSASGGTIHHLGQSPTRGTPQPLGNPAQHTSIVTTTMNVQQLQAQLMQQQQTVLMSPQSQQTTPPAQVVRRQSGSGSPGVTVPTRTNPLFTAGFSPLGAQNTNRTSPSHSPDRPRKRIKLEEKLPASPEVSNYRKLICDEKLKAMAEIKENYTEHLTELFFLQNGGNMMDYYAWKKRPTMPLVHFLKSGSMDSDEEDFPPHIGTEKKINDEVKVITTSGGTTPLATPVAISTTLPPAVSAIQQQQGGVPLVGATSSPGAASVVPVTPVLSSVISTPTAPATTMSSMSHTPLSSSTVMPTASSSSSTSITASPALSSQLAKVMAETTTTTAQAKTTTAGLNTATSVTSALSISSTTKTVSTPKSPAASLSPRLGTRQHSISSFSLDHAIDTQEAIVERAKQEAQVIQRVAELRKEGLWSSRRLPKVQEPPRNKAHWDYLLEEMQWLAADFTQERKWKKAGARKIARMITRYFQELQQKEQKAKKKKVPTATLR